MRKKVIRWSVDYSYPEDIYYIEEERHFLGLIYYVRLTPKLTNSAMIEEMFEYMIKLDEYKSYWSVI